MSHPGAPVFIQLLLQTVRWGPRGSQGHGHGCSVALSPVAHVAPLACVWAACPTTARYKSMVPFGRSPYCGGLRMSTLTPRSSLMNHSVIYILVSKDITLNIGPKSQLPRISFQSLYTVSQGSAPRPHLLTPLARPCRWSQRPDQLFPLASLSCEAQLLWGPNSGPRRLGLQEDSLSH